LHRQGKNALRSPINQGKTGKVFCFGARLTPYWMQNCPGHLYQAEKMLDQNKQRDKWLYFV